VRSRLRVSVSDGFNRTRGLSGTFRAKGAPPSAQLLSPDSTSGLQAGVPTELLASAVDGTGKRLRGRALTWFAGSRRLGFGERLRVSLPAGTQRLRLRVRDAGGRERVLTRRVTVAPVALRFTTLRVPEHVKAGARNVAIRVSSTIAASLRLNGRSYAIGTRARRILIALPRKPGAGVLKLRFTLVPRGGKTAATDATVFIVRS
jgi:hypothetical protein